MEFPDVKSWRTSVISAVLAECERWESSRGLASGIVATPWSTEPTIRLVSVTSKEVTSAPDARTREKRPRSKTATPNPVPKYVFSPAVVRHCTCRSGNPWSSLNESTAPAYQWYTICSSLPIHKSDSVPACAVTYTLFRDLCKADK